jgi:hypothetical protein
VEIDSRPEDGTRIRVRLPLEADEADKRTRVRVTALIAEEQASVAESL